MGRSPYATRPPYVLPCDRDAVEAHNARCAEPCRYRLDLLPEPYFGRPDAPVVVLMSNPGVGEEDAGVHRQAGFVDAARRSLVHALPARSPFLHLREDAPGGGRDYWLQRARELSDRVGLERVQSGLLVLQLAPYHSPKFKASRAVALAGLHPAVARGRT